MKMLHTEAEVVSQKQVAGRAFRLCVRAPEIAARATPGQFVMVKAGPGTDPLLRRPLSIHAADGKTVVFLYEVVGPSTALLAQRRPGERVGVLGPLGNGFELPGSRSAAPVIVAGGIGTAPLFFLAQHLVGRSGIKPLVLIGARTREQLVCAQDFRRLGCAVRLATDDGTLGARCRVTDLLERILDRTISARRRAGRNSACVRIYACGPGPMLRQIARISAARHIPAQISLEAHMACGIGACLGCAVKTASGFQRVCKEGPVFAAQDILW